ncbi:hypothetical protein GCM10008944_01520 [Cytobacillus oceanisediminis]
MAEHHHDRVWTELSLQVRAEEPLCRIRIPGVCTTISTAADHILPSSRYPHLELERSNLQGACRPCNRAKSDLTMDELIEKLGLDDGERPALAFFTS